MNDVAMPEEWEILRRWLPADLNQRARATGFMQRARGLQDAECWLRLILMHVAGGLSLQQTTVRARELGLAQVTSVALFKRLRKAERWLWMRRTFRNQGTPEPVCGCITACACPN